MNPLINLGLYGDFDICDKDLIKGLNDNFELLDNLVQFSFNDIVSVLPSDPIEGDRYILSTDGSINLWNGSDWVKVQSQDGFQGINKSNYSLWAYDGSSWNAVGGDDSLKKDRSGLNLLANGSFELPSGTSEWIGFDSVLSQAPTTLLTAENKLSMHIDGEALSTVTSTLLVPVEMVGLKTVFQGWIGPRAEDVQIGIFNNLQASTIIIPSSVNWEKFKIGLVLDSTTVDLEFRVTDAVSYQVDELFFGPDNSFPSEWGNIDGDISNQIDLSLILASKAAISQVYSYAPVDGLVLDFQYTTQHATISSDSTFSFDNIIPGKSLVVAILASGGNRNILFSSPVIHRPDMPLEILDGKINIYTFVAMPSGIYVACVDGME